MVVAENGAAGGSSSETDTAAAPGTRVVADPLIPCRACATCRAGRTYVCPDRTLLSLHRDGGQAQLVAVPRENLVAVPNELSFEAAALAEPLATIIHAFDAAHHGPMAGRRVLVLGAGGLGLLAVQVARSRGADEVASVELVERRRLLAKRLGAVTRDPDAVEERSADVVVDTVGAASTRELAVRAAVPEGAIALVGQRDPSSELDFRTVIAKGLRLTGVYAYAREHLERAVAALADRTVVTEAFVSTFPLRDGPDVYRSLVERPDEVVKAVLIP